jgi:hypothetical protein
MGSDESMLDSSRASLYDALKSDQYSFIEHILTRSHALLESGLAVSDPVPILSDSPPPLSVAAFFHAHKSLRLLLSYGANIRQCDEKKVLFLLIGFRSILHLRLVMQSLLGLFLSKVQTQLNLMLKLSFESS